MCMLSYIPAGVDIEAEDLLNGGILNPDGSGYAIASDKGIIMGKSMKVEEALDEFIAKRKKHPDAPALFHSRWATHGTNGIANVHPFLVGGSHRTVMAHNGILPCTPTKDDWRSDTRILADEFIGKGGKFRRFDKPGAMKALSDYIGPGNKLVILTTDPKYAKNAYIVNEHKGNWDKLSGVWHSNYDYLGSKYYSGKGTYGYTNVTGKAGKGYTTTKGSSYVKNEQGIWEPSKSDNCVFCGYGVIGKAGYCLECGTCDDCGDFRQDCQCWSGYYANFDWSAPTTPRSSMVNASGLPVDKDGIVNIGGRSRSESADDDVPMTADDYARAGMSLAEIMDQMEEGQD